MGCMRTLSAEGFNYFVVYMLTIDKLFVERELVLARNKRTCSFHQSDGYDCSREHAYFAPALRYHLDNLYNKRVTFPHFPLFGDGSD